MIKLNHVTNAAATFIISSCLLAPVMSGQQKRPTSDKFAAGGAPELRAEQQEALGLLRRVADEVKSEPDKLAAAQLQAHAADVLWKFDEPLARSFFRSAFDAANKLVADGGPTAGQTGGDDKNLLRRQAAVIKEVLRRLSAHDRQSAEEWLKQVEKERPGEKQAAGSISPQRAELLAQLGLEMADNDPERAKHLGLISLSGDSIPESFGRLLFALNNRDRSLSNALFREAVAAMRRGRFNYSTALFSLTNYLFDQRGKLSADADAADARLLISYFVDAASAHTVLWREAKQAGAELLPESSAQLHNFLTLYASPVIDLNAPDRQAQLRMLIGELGTGLNQQQQQHTERLASDHQRQAGTNTADASDIDAYLRQAEKETNRETRDLMLRRVAVSLMRGDSQRALSIASKIDNPALRAQTEDDINLVSLSIKLREGLHDEARQVALKLNELGLKAKVLAELASAALSKPRDVARASELLTEAYDFSLKSEDKLTKLESLLFIAEQFAKFDPTRGFEVLAVGVKTMNQLEVDGRVTESNVTARPAMRLVSITALNGKEMTTGHSPTLDSINFSLIKRLVKHDYTTAKGMMEKIENKLLRAKLLIEVASSALGPPEK